MLLKGEMFVLISFGLIIASILVVSFYAYIFVKLLILLTPKSDEVSEGLDMQYMFIDARRFGDTVVVTEMQI